MLGNLSTSQMTGVPVHLAPINKTERKKPRGPLQKKARWIPSAQMVLTIIQGFLN